MKTYTQKVVKELMKIGFTVITFDENGKRLLTHGTTNVFEAMQAVIVGTGRNPNNKVLVFEGHNTFDKHTGDGWHIDDYKGLHLDDYSFMSDKIQEIKKA